MREGRSRLVVLALALMVSAGISSERVKAAQPGSQWPTDRRGLVFLWGTANNEVIAYGSDGKAINAYSLRPRSLAHLNRNYAMVLRHGSYLAEDLGPYLLSAFKKSGELTVEAYLTPSTLRQRQPVPIISFSSESSEPDFSLVQENGSLVSLLKTTTHKAAHLPLAKVSAQKSSHLIVSYKPGFWVCYINGEKVSSGSTITGGFSNWLPANLTFGSGSYGGARITGAGRSAGVGTPHGQGVDSSGWEGNLEGVALLNRFMGEQEARQDYAAYISRIKQRKSVPQLELLARLVARSRVPSYQKIAPYFQALVVYEYKVERVISGKYHSQKIRVAHWGMMDKKPLPISSAPLNQSYHLVLEPFSANPQLESEYQSDTLPEDENLELYYDPEIPT